MKSFLFFVVGGILGVVAGAGGMLIAFPFIFPPPPATESVQGEVALLGETRFRETSAGQDTGHWGRGGIKVYRAEDGSVLAELQDDFEVGPGPNFWLYLNGEKNIEPKRIFWRTPRGAKRTKLKVFPVRRFTGLAPKNLKTRAP